MAARPPTYTWSDVINIIGRKGSRSVSDDMSVYIANLTQSWVSDKYDWRWTTAGLPSFYLVPNEQDFAAPEIAIPQDFYGLRWANLIRADNVPPYRQPLRIIKDLQTTHIRYLPHALGYVPDKQCFRIYPRFPDNLGSPIYFVEGVYKKLMPKITATNLATTFLPSDDVYFDMWVETARWQMYKLDGDPRAGVITSSNGVIGAQGQAAVMMDIMSWAADKEGLELGEPVISPEEPLVSSGPYRPALFGLGFSF